MKKRDPILWENVAIHTVLSYAFSRSLGFVNKNLKESDF